MVTEAVRKLNHPMGWFTAEAATHFGMGIGIQNLDLWFYYVMVLPLTESKINSFGEFTMCAFNKRTPKGNKTMFFFKKVYDLLF